MAFSSTHAKASAGTSLLWLGVLLFACSALAALTLAIIAVSLAASDPSSALEVAAGAPCLGGLVLVLSFGCIVAGRGLRAQAKKEQYLADHGRSARGTILSVAPTGIGFGEAPLMKLTVRVELEGKEPYEAVFRMCIPEDQPNPPVGSVIGLRVDPSDPRQVTAEPDLMDR